MNSNEFVELTVAVAAALDTFPTAEEILPGLIELGVEMDKAWKRAFPFAVLNCSDDRLILVLGRRKRGKVQRLWDWMTGK